MSDNNSGDANTKFEEPGRTPDKAEGSDPDETCEGDDRFDPICEPKRTPGRAEG